MHTVCMCVRMYVSMCVCMCGLTVRAASEKVFPVYSSLSCSPYNSLFAPAQGGAEEPERAGERMWERKSEVSEKERVATRH